MTFKRLNAFAKQLSKQIPPDYDRTELLLIRGLALSDKHNASEWDTDTLASALSSMRWIAASLARTTKPRLAPLAGRLAAYKGPYDR